MTMEYVSGEMLTKTYRPDSLLIVDCTVPLAAAVMRTDAPGIAAPCSSETRPAMELVDVACENAGVAVSTLRDAQSNAERHEDVPPKRKTISPPKRIKRD